MGRHLQVVLAGGDDAADGAEVLGGQADAAPAGASGGLLLRRRMSSSGESSSSKLCEKRTICTEGSMLHYTTSSLKERQETMPHAHSITEKSHWQLMI